MHWTHSSASGESAAYELLEQLRWGGEPRCCPHCASIGACYFLRPADGISRRTRVGNRSARRVWKCASCRRQFSVLTGTIVQGTKIALAVWIAVVAAIVGSAGRTPSAAVVQARHGLSPDAARHVLGLLAAALDLCEPALVRDSREGRAEPEQALSALLLIDAAEATRLRAQFSRRARPLRQFGPTADHGDPRGSWSP